MKPIHWLVLASVALRATLSLANTSDKPYKMYQADWSVLDAYPQQKLRWQELLRKGQKNGMTLDVIKARLEIIEPIVDKHQDWIDGLWMSANTHMLMGETFSSDNKEGSDEVRRHFEKAKERTDKCLVLKPDQPICKFFNAAASGKIATLDGIFASLGKGYGMHQSWMEVYNSGVEYVFNEGISLQGLTRYALGIYYRVVPDFFLLRWVYGISGDIDKSVRMHKEAVAMPGGKNACSYLMLGVSLLCRSGGDLEEEDTREGLGVLRKVPSYARNENNVSEMVCVKGAAQVSAKPSDACGYTKAQVLERDESAMKGEATSH